MKKQIQICFGLLVLVCALVVAGCGGGGGGPGLPTSGTHGGMIHHP